MKNIIFWDLLTCDLKLFTCPEGGGDTFLRNVGSKQNPHSATSQKTIFFNVCNVY
jgi:hypothetical protein